MIGRKETVGLCVNDRQSLIVCHIEVMTKQL